MKPVARSELLDLGEYEQIRDSFRRRIIDLKKNRRVAIGSNMTAVFENHDTVLYQIQEMLRTERITRHDAIVHEMETYNDLLPGPGELSATIFIEYPDAAERDAMLVKLEGVEHCFYVEVGGSRCPGRSETRGVQPGRTTAVHYVKFPLGEAAEGVSSDAVVAVGVEHAEYSARTELEPETVAELRADLTE